MRERGTVYPGHDGNFPERATTLGDRQGGARRQGSGPCLATLEAPRATLRAAVALSRACVNCELICGVGARCRRTI